MPNSPFHAARLITAAGLISAAWLLVRHRHNALFYLRLLGAQREAARFYRACPRLTKDIAPHTSVRTRLDVYQPDDAPGHAVLLYVYGGSWRSGSKALYAPLAQRLLPAGLVVVIPEYTPYPAARFPQPVKEVAAAIAWTLDHIHQFGGDPRRLVIGAQSAGAQIAGLALLDPRWLAAYGHSAADVRGFVGISGVYDVPAEVRFARRNGRFVERVMGGPANLAAASPINFVSPAAPPALLIHGDADSTVPYSMSAEFYRRLRFAGVSCELLRYHRAGHSGILFDALAQNSSTLVSDVTRFVHQRAAPPLA